MNRVLRCVILDRIYDIWDDPQAQALFQELVNLKRSGFGREYGYGVLPVDTLDLVSTHFAVCEERDGRLIPLMGARMTTLKRCRLFNQTFPALQLCTLASAPYHGSAFQQMIDGCSSGNGANPSYWGLWTIHPDARQDRHLAAFLIKSLGGVGHWLARELGVTDQILGATLRFKVDRTGRTWGFEPLQLDGQDLPPLYVAHLLGEAVLLMRQTEPSANALELMEEFREFWDQRLVFAPQDRLSDDPPADAQVAISHFEAPVVTPSSIGASGYLPSLLYARDRYGALPEVPAGKYLEYLKAVMVIVGGDGELSANEWSQIHDLVRQLGLPEQSIQELCRFDWRHADLAELATAISGTGMPLRMLYDALWIAESEGFEPGAHAALERAARALKVSNAQLSELIQLVAGEAKLRRRRAAALFPCVNDHAFAQAC